jgi:hypothetical protein
MKRLLITLAAVAIALPACASGTSDSERLALYRTHAMPPVESFRYLNRIDGWTPLGDTAVAIWTHPNEAYLLEVDTPCPDLEFAQAIGLTSNSGTVYSRFDKVIPRAGGRTPTLPCPIRQIRPLDVKALKSAEKDIRRQREGASS